MPKNKSALLRYRIIDEMLRSTPATYPTLEQIREKISEQIGKISASSVEKDINAMKTDEVLSNGNLAPIAHHPYYKGYYYTESGYSFFQFPLDEKDLEALRLASTTLYQFKDSIYMARFKGAIEKIGKGLMLGTGEKDVPLENYIQYETAPVAGGSEHIETLFNAIRESKVVTFTYHNVYKNVMRQCTAAPYLLKEYHNRWYLISHNEDKNDYLTYGLDRISELSVTDRKFSRNEEFKPEIFFKHCIGITEYDHKPQKVVLSFSPSIGKLILLQPIHSSQTTLRNTDKEVRVQLEVLLTHELIALILGYRDHVKVIGPKGLQKEIMEAVRKVAKKYK